MGWLFAVALGLQQGTGWAISRALVFVTAGHAASLVVIAVVLAFIGSFVPAGQPPDHRRSGAVVVRRIQAVTLLPAPALGGDAGRPPGPFRLVLPHGHIPRGGT